MLPHHQPDRVRIAFDDHRLVANARLILPSTPVYPGVGGEPTPDDIGPGQVSTPVVRPGPARHVPSRAPDFGGARHTPSARGAVLSNHTNRNYARAWTAFSKWCGTQGIPALPARPSDIVMYLDKMAGRGETGYHDPGSSGRHFPWAPYGWVCGPHGRCLRQGLPVGSGGVRFPPPAPGRSHLLKQS